MWKQRSENVPSSGFAPVHEPVRPPSPNPADDLAMKSLPPAAAGDPAFIGKGIKVLGEISGDDSLCIDGTVEGTIRIPGGRVTIDRNGHVLAGELPEGAPCIVAREIVIIGTVTGNVDASERVELRAQASLTGNVNTARVAIEDGACFRGGIDIRRDGKPSEAEEPHSASEAVPISKQKAAALETVQV